MSKENPLWLAATATAYILGVATGILAVRFHMERKYRKLADEEVESVKEAFRREEEKSKAEREGRHIMSDEDKRKLDAVYANLIDERKYAPRDERSEDAVVISTDEYGELISEGYTGHTITYYEGNGVFFDEDTQTVLTDEEWESMLGCGVAKHFGENEDDEDAVYIRNDARRAYYDVIRVEDAYEE